MADDAQRPNLAMGLLLPRGTEPDSESIIALQNALGRRIVRRIQAERCSYWHEAAERGEFLRFLIWEVRPWTALGFPVERLFGQSSIVAAYGRQDAPTGSHLKGGIPESYKEILAHLRGYWGNRELRRFSEAFPWIHGEKVGVIVALLGGPPMLLLLCEAIWRLLDMLYAAVQGDYAVALAEWLRELLTSIRPFAVPWAELIDRTEKTHSEREQRQLLTSLWAYSGAPFLEGLSRLEADVQVWLASKPSTIEGGPDWPLPPNPSDKGRSGYVVNNMLGPYLNTLQQLTGGTLNVTAQARKVSILMTGGAYRRGGRKPPSVSHGTTFGVDLDLTSGVKGESFNSPPARSVKAARDWIQRALRDGVVAETPPAGSAAPSVPVNTLFGHRQFEAAVMFTQAILLCLPSRLYYGDIVVLSAAVGGLSEVLEPSHMALVQRVSYHFEPVIHFNHWHVDWLPPTMHEEPCSNWALLYFDEQRSCANHQAEVPPLSRKRWKRQFVRPVYYGSDKTEPGTAAELEAIVRELGERVPLTGPVGDVASTDKVINWIRTYGLSRRERDKSPDGD